MFPLHEQKITKGHWWTELPAKDASQGGRLTDTILAFPTDLFTAAGCRSVLTSEFRGSGDNSHGHFIESSPLRRRSPAPGNDRLAHRGGGGPFLPRCRRPFLNSFAHMSSFLATKNGERGFQGVGKVFQGRGNA